MAVYIYTDVYMCMSIINICREWSGYKLGMVDSRKAKDDKLLHRSLDNSLRIESQHIKGRVELSVPIYIDLL